jgi:hypothetical protein
MTLAISNKAQFRYSSESSDLLRLCVLSAERSHDLVNQFPLHQIEFVLNLCSRQEVSRVLVCCHDCPKVNWAECFHQVLIF